MKAYDRCGDCKLWMTQQCPREPGDRIRKIYNSCGAFKCDKFIRTQYSTEQEGRDKIKEQQDLINEQKRRREEAILLADLFKSFF